jgi:hypothetical protein
MGNYKKHISSLGYGMSSLIHGMMSNKNSVRIVKGQAAMEILLEWDLTYLKAMLMQ